MIQKFNIMKAKFICMPKIGVYGNDINEEDQPIRLRSNALRKIITKSQIRNEMLRQESMKDAKRERPTTFQFDSIQNDTNELEHEEVQNLAKVVHNMLKNLIIDDKFQEKCDSEFEMLIKRIAKLEEIGNNNENNGESKGKNETPVLVFLFI